METWDLLAAETFAVILSKVGDSLLMCQKLKLLTPLVSVALTDAVKATDTVNWALLPACVCTFKRTWLKLQTLFEPASLPQF